MSKQSKLKQNKTDQSKRNKTKTKKHKKQNKIKQNELKQNKTEFKKETNCTLCKRLKIKVRLYCALTVPCFTFSKGAFRVFSTISIGITCRVYPFKTDPRGRFRSWKMRENENKTAYAHCQRWKYDTAQFFHLV